MRNNYNDIINLSRPVSKRPKMSLEQRSAQFAPFAALTGYDGQVKETARLTNRKIEIDEEGHAELYHMSYDVLDKATKMIEDIIKEPVIGEVYTVKVVKVEDFGAFVELWPGCEGLVHVSQLDNKRVNHPSDIVSVGDEIVVKATGYDKKGKLNLSRKELLPKIEKKEEKKKEDKSKE